MPRFGLPVHQDRDRIAAAQIVGWYSQSMKRVGYVRRTTISEPDGIKRTTVEQPLDHG